MAVLLGPSQDGLAAKPGWTSRLGNVDPLDFSPPLLRIQAQPPTPFARGLLYLLLVLLAFLILWSAFGRLDIVATAEGKLLPQSYIKIVQPSEQGVIREILVNEGEAVKAGQVLMRMDATLSEADGRELQSDYSGKKIALRRIDAELADQSFKRHTGDSEKDYADALAQYQANRAAYESAQAEEQSQHDKAQSDLMAAQETRDKLLQTLPHYRNQDEAYTQLAKEGYVSRLEATDKAREHIEKEQDLKTQEHLIAGAQAMLTQSARKLAHITAEYRQKLQTERADTEDKLDKVGPELAKQQYHRALHELRAPQDGCGRVAAEQPGTRRPTPCGYIVKDLATHTPGTVISPGSILLTLVPMDETLRAEVWVSNQDVGFIHTGNPVKLKLATYQFQKYGMLDGEVNQLSADASDNTSQSAQTQMQPQLQGNNKSGANLPFAYRALIDLKSQYLEEKGVRHRLTPGMQVTAEINLGTRSIIEYLLSPVMEAFQEAGRER